MSVLGDILVTTVVVMAVLLLIGVMAAIPFMLIDGLTDGRLSEMASYRAHQFLDTFDKEDDDAE